MKRFVAVTVAVLMLSCNVNAAAINVNLNNEAVEFSNQEPVIVDGRTLIPLRGVFEKLGYEITWNGETKSAEFINAAKKVKITADSTTFVVDDDMVYELDVPAQIINGSMMLPLRAVGEAAGLEVGWDSESKTVSLISENNSAVTDVSEIPEADLEALKKAARCYVNYNSITVMVNSFMDTNEYSMYKIDSALQFMFSDEESMKIFDDAIAECERYKTVASAMITNEMDKNMISLFGDFVDKTVDDYKFMKDYYCDGKYDDLTDDELVAKAKSTLENAKAALVNLATTMESSYAAAWEIFESSKYNCVDSSKLTDAEKQARDAYYKEIGETANQVTDFLKNADDAKSQPDKFINAAQELRNKLNTTYTPEVCSLEREIMLICCDLMEQSGNAVRNGAFADDSISEAYIELEYSMFVFESMLYHVLGDGYETKCIEKNIDSSTEDILDDFDSKFV